MSTHNDHGDYYHRDVPHSYTNKLESEIERLQALLETHNAKCAVCDHVTEVERLQDFHDRVCQVHYDEVVKLQAENVKLRKMVDVGGGEANRRSGQWISVEKLLPGPGERVIVSFGGFVGEGYRDCAGKWYRHYGAEGFSLFGTTASHWQPLPAKEVED